jgi:hypothetical protein
MPMVRSELTGEMVDTSSEAWRHECEVRHLLDKMSPAQLKTFLEGGEESRGIVSHRGPMAVEHLKAEMQRLAEARYKAKQAGGR